MKYCLCLLLWLTLLTFNGYGASSYSAYVHEIHPTGNSDSDNNKGQSIRKAS